MSRVWLRFGDELPPPVVPLPDSFGILGECLRSGEFFRPKVAPKASRSAKCGDSAFSGDACACQHANRTRPPKKFAKSLCPIWVHLLNERLDFVPGFESPFDRQSNHVAFLQTLDDLHARDA